MSWLVENPALTTEWKEAKKKKNASKDAPLQERKAGKMPALRKKACGD
jgi:hypothetical protein